jgi:hypothetical protein
LSLRDPQGTKEIARRLPECFPRQDGGRNRALPRIPGVASGRGAGVAELRDLLGALAETGPIWGFGGPATHSKAIRIVVTNITTRGGIAGISFCYPSEAKLQNNKMRVASWRYIETN